MHLKASMVHVEWPGSEACDDGRNRSATARPRPQADSERDQEQHRIVQPLETSHMGRPTYRLHARGARYVDSASPCPDHGPRAVHGHP